MENSMIILLGILYLVVPFSVFGIKSYLKNINTNLIKCGELLIEIKKLLRNQIQNEKETKMLAKKPM